MRNRTELVTNNLPDSDNEEEEIDDSEEDWKPEKKAGRGGSKVVSPKGGKRKSSGRGRPAKKSKKDESDDEDEEEVDDEEEEEDNGDDDDEENESEENESDDDEDDKPKKGESKSPKRGRAVSNVGKNQPDKDGFMELYLFKNDLTKAFREDPKLCLWRRDGASLLQKYLVVKNESETRDVYFNASSVYSCWEEKRKHDFFQIKVQLIGEKKDGKVQVVNIDELEQYAAEDRPPVDLTPKGAEPQAQNEEPEDDDDGLDEEEE